MKELKKEVKQVINSELIRANKKFPLFSSNHEAYAIILEELEETSAELKRAENELADMWQLTKENFSTNYIVDRLEKGRMAMLLCACEAIQTSAMFEKALCSLYERERRHQELKDAVVENKADKFADTILEMLGIEVDINGNTKGEEEKE